MKKIVVLLIVSLFFTSTLVLNAVSFPDLFPGGKNYLDANNFELIFDELETKENIKVKPNTAYTISVPGFEHLGENTAINIVGDVIYLNGNVENTPLCDINHDLTQCTFTTSSSEKDIYVLIGSSDMQRFYSYYEMEGFQLEEGMEATTYEPYVSPVMDSASPNFSGTGAYILSYENPEPIENIINNHIVVIDDIDGDVSDQIVIDSNEYSGNEGVIGLYDVLLSASDSSGNVSQFTLTIIVKDEIPPIIQGNKEITLPVHTDVGAEAVLEDNIVYFDEYDANPVVTITEDDFTDNKSTLGIYQISFEVEDSSGNKITDSISITLVDTEAPILSGAVNVTTYTSNLVDVNTVVNSLLFSDNYDPINKLVSSIISENYAVNKNHPGTYEVVVSTKDSSNNEVVNTITISVIDDTPPAISGPVSYSFSYENTHSLTDIINLLSVSDNVDLLDLSDIQINSDTYSGNENIVGTYKIEVLVTDSNGNSTSHEIDVSVIDDIAPVIYVDNYIVTVDVTSTFTEKDAISLLLNAKEIPKGEYQVLSIKNEYQGNETVAGIYEYQIELSDDKGNHFVKDFAIRVTNENSDNNDTNVIVRNIAIYSVVITFIAFVYYKKR